MADTALGQEAERDAERDAERMPKRAAEGAWEGGCAPGCTPEAALDIDRLDAYAARSVIDHLVPRRGYL
jgi:hypothetical protein